MKYLILLLMFILPLSSHARGKTWVTTEYQFDSRDFNTLNFTGFSALPKGFSVWGFVDFEAAKGASERESDLATNFLEIDLRTPRYKGLGVILEVNSQSGSKNDLGRAGLYYLPKYDWLDRINLFLFFKAFPIETDGEGGQFSFAWDLKFPGLLQGRLSAGGFVDWNFKSGSSKTTHVVTDTQIRCRIAGNLAFLVEFRKNEFLASKESGTAVGLKYKF